MILHFVTQTIYKYWTEIRKCTLAEKKYRTEFKNTYFITEKKELNLLKYTYDQSQMGLIIVVIIKYYLSIFSIFMLHIHCKLS